MTGNTHFVFRHRVFCVDGSYFSSRKGGRDPCLNIPMGKITATIAVPVLRKEFTIPDGSEDGRLLDVVERAAVVRGQGHFVTDDFERVRVLLSHAFTKIGSEFDLVDRQHEDVLSALCDMATQVQLVRDVRDEIHYEMMM